MSILSSNTLFDDESSSWKTVVIFYIILVMFLILDVGNTTFLMSPMHFSFVPILLFIGAIKLPSFVIPFVGFCAGMFTDILSYAPIGLLGLMYFLTVFICRWQYRFILAQPFYIIWLFFSGYFTLFCTVEWLFQSLYHRYIFDISSEVFVLIYGIIFFPVLWGLLFKVRSFFSFSQENI